MALNHRNDSLTFSLALSVTMVTFFFLQMAYTEKNVFKKERANND